MSGICAVWERTDLPRVVPVLESMLSRLALDRAERAALKSAGTAAVAVSAFFPGQEVYGDATVMVVCDAELYNRQELESLLTSTEMQGPLGPENEVAGLLGRLYVRFGNAFVSKLRGVFAFAIWDRKRQVMTAAVDGFGVKRLTYYHDGERLLIATRLDAITGTGEVDCSLSPQAVAHYVNFGVNLAPTTIFAKIRRIEPGSLLIVDAMGALIEKYWDMKYGPGSHGGVRELSGSLERIMSDSVALHCQGESLNHIGAFLSGGTDSSTVLGLMSRHYQAPVQAFSIGFEDDAFNELDYARLAAGRYHARHYTYLVSPADCFESLERMVRAFDEPFGNSSAIPTYFCARMAAQAGIRVLLAGDGGDELFAGNQRYLTDKIFGLYQRVPGFLRRRLESSLAVIPFEGRLLGLARKYILRSNLPNPQRFFSYDYLCSHPLQEIFDPEFLVSLGEYSIMEAPMRLYAAAPARDELDRLLYIDVKMTLGDSDLPKVTCMSELGGVQARFPYLDRSVAEFSGKIPAGLKLKGFNKRYIFKRAFAEILPKEIIRKKKHGFGIPVSRWLKSYRPLAELARDVLLSQRSMERGFFRRGLMQDLFRAFEDDESTYYGDTLWSFLILELWQREFSDRVARAA